MLFELDNDFERVYFFLKRMSKEFNPPLSDRVCIESYSHKLTDFGNNLFASIEGVDVAGASYYERAGVAFLSSFCVCAEYRREGIASGLMDDLINRLIDKRIYCISLEVNKKAYQAISFYETKGFMISGVNDAEYYAMKLCINDS